MKLTHLALFSVSLAIGSNPGAMMAAGPVTNPVQPLICPPMALFCALPSANPKSDIPPTPTVSPLQTALAKLVADSATWESTNGSLSAAQAIVTQLTPIAGSLATQIQADQAAIAALVNPNNPTPGPVVPQVSLLVLSSDSCAPCKLIQPILDKLVGAGLPIAVSKLDADATKYAIKATPTFVMLLGTKEVSRSVGTLDEVQIRDWIAKTQTWVNNGGGK